MDFQAHFLLVPFMSHSHLIPFTEMAKQLAHHGQTVTILMTPLNAVKYNKILEYAQDYSLKIKFLSLEFPCKEAGLPEGCENRDSVPSQDLVPRFFKASNMMQESLEKWLEGLEEAKPNCLISDICLPWTTETANKFKISRIVFHGISCFSLLCNHKIHQYKVLDSANSDFEPLLVPEIPDRIEFVKTQIPEASGRISPEVRAMLDRFKAAELSAEGVVVNTFEELESDYVNGYRKTVKNLWCVGPLSQQNNSSNYEHEALKWLDLKEQSSVLYVCFGSLCQISAKQLIELGSGLEASKHSFIWVIREGNYTSELEKWMEDKKFEERVKERGLVIRTWVPQVQILSHKATGGFLTHCGWNSTLEGVSSGLPMITWPMFAEQFLNEKLVVQVLKIGVRIWGQEEKGGDVVVNIEDIKMAIDQVMGDYEGAEDRRRRARELGKMAKRAVEKDGSSYLNTKMLIQYAMEHVANVD